MNRFRASLFILQTLFGWISESAHFIGALHTHSHDGCHILKVSMAIKSGHGVRTVFRARKTVLTPSLFVSSVMMLRLRGA